jgi:hypothetical protein
MSTADIIGNRISLTKVFGERGKPGINADILSSTEATRMVTDPDFEVLGTNGSSDDVTYNAEGGILLTTDGADGDGVIILPHLDANQSPWTRFTWGTDNETEWECWFKMGAAVTSRIVWAGLKLTNTDVIGTDDDSAFIRYEDGVNDEKWQSNVSVADTDNTVDTGIVGVADQFMHVRIVFDAAEVCHIYVNGREVQAVSFSGNSADLIPYVATEADGAAAASTLVVFGEKISRKVS